jgi:hypothetical protein
MDVSDVLKRAVIKSLGESVREIITIKRSRFQQITVAEIIARVRARFGKLQKDTKTALKLKMNSMLKAVEDMDKHISALTKLFTISETAGSVVDDDTIVDYFRDSLFGHSILANILKQFDFEHPDCTTITYVQITAYVVLHLANLKTAQQAATHTGSGKYQRPRRYLRSSFKETFSHHPSFLSSMSRFYESFPLSTDHTVPNLVAHITPSPTQHLGCCCWVFPNLPQPPTAASSSDPPVPPSKMALKKAARKGKQGKQRDQHSALLQHFMV